MKLFLLLIVTVSVLQAALVRDSSLQVVKDTEKRLMWQDNKAVIQTYLTHKEALAYCENLKHAGYNNWRLPLINEYKAIVDMKTKTHINRAFRFNKDQGYWAYRAHFRTLWYYADYMHFVSGTAYFDNRKVNKLVRCVRDMK
jgi:hypothetical protein